VPSRLWSVASAFSHSSVQYSSNGVPSSLTGVTYSAVTRLSVVASVTESSVYVMVRPIVHDDTSAELGFAGFLTVFDNSVFTVSERRCCEVASRLNETRL